MCELVLLTVDIRLEIKHIITNLLFQNKFELSNKVILNCCY